MTALLSNGLVAAALLLATASAGAKDLNVMSYNVRNGRGLDNERNTQRIAKVIKDQKPDIVAVQELDSMTRRSGQTYVLGELASQTGMKAYYAPAIDYDGGKYGIGLLCKKKPVSITRRALPGREEQRAIIIAEFRDYIFACTHLSLTDEDRMQSVQIIRDLARKAGKPFFLAGDLNSHPDSPVIQDLSKDFQILTSIAEPTFPADTPDEVIDYIMVYNAGKANVKTVSSEVVDEKVASDHRPIKARVKISK